MIFVSIGIDCDVANFLNKYNLRKASLPFDWNVSYNGVSKCIDSDFKNFTDFAEPLNINRINGDDVYFHHDFLEEATIPIDKDKYSRRCQRLLNMFEECQTTSEPVLFIRKGHLCYHHEEQNGKYANITDDYEDAKRLNDVLRTKYPLLKYKIILLLGCTKCFKKDTVCMKDTANNIEVYNNVCDASEDRNRLFEECLLNVCVAKLNEEKGVR
uniref:Uncharacterized protein n=1 Tax=viral metagenome TaxID=1070528 RepID=A0A6C0K6A0_9ZZZZ